MGLQINFRTDYLKWDNESSMQEMKEEDESSARKFSFLKNYSLSKTSS